MGPKTGYSTLVLQSSEAGDHDNGDGDRSVADREFFNRFRHDHRKENEIPLQSAPVQSQSALISHP